MARNPNDDMSAATAAHRQGAIEKAAKLYTRVVDAAPDYVPALCALGICYLQLGRPAEAVKPLGRAAKVSPASFEAMSSYGLALAMSGNSQDALPVLERALAIQPHDVNALLNHGNALQALGRHADAIESYNRAFAGAPQHPQLHNSLGNALAATGQYREAIHSYDRALAIDPRNANAIENRANTLAWAGQIEEALATFGRALALDPTAADVYFARGCARLRHGDFAEGWKDYEWRLRQASTQPHRRDFRSPAWRGDAPLAGKSILLHAEQGFGDTLQFVRYVPIVAALGAHVVLEVQPALKSLLASTSGAASVIARGERLPPFDFHCPLPSLPLAFKTDAGTIPSGGPYIAAAPARIGKWRSRLPAAHRRVGIVWSGNPAFKNDHLRSMRLEQVTPLFEVPDVAFVSINPAVSAADAVALAARANVTHLGGELKDFSDTAGLLDQLDLLITTCTASAHLAGAMGKPVWIMLMTESDWRWLLGREDSPWYPSARLFRQPRFNDWHAVVGQVAEELRRL